MPQIRWALGETKPGCFLNNTITITLKEKVPDRRGGCHQIGTH